MKINSPTMMAYPSPPRRAAGAIRYVLVAVILLCLLWYMRQSTLAVSQESPHVPIDNSSPYSPAVPSAEVPAKGKVKPTEVAHVPVTDAADPVASSTSAAAIEESTSAAPAPKSTGHPIDTLIEKAEKEFQDLLGKESKDLPTAAAEYRKRRGRHPPPGFDVWFKFAQDHGAVMVEDFFDQIYHDLGPFWGQPAALMRKEAGSYEMTINVRNKKATAGSDWFWTKIWLNMTQTIEQYLPDIDIPLNAMDEPRIVAPWEEVDKYMQKERESRQLAPVEGIISQFRAMEDHPASDVQARPKEFTDKRPFWKIATQGCHPDSLSRKAEIMTDFSNTPSISLTHTVPFTYKGYISNFSLSTDFCHQPDLQSLHGMMIDPLSVSASKVLFPLFGGSKLPTNNEILLPAPMYWNNEERFTGGDDHGKPWAEKEDRVIWRGVATGGHNRHNNWKGFQRHRFVAMTNGTKVSNAESWAHLPENWAMPTSQYNLAAQQEGKLGEWTGSWADTGFVDLMCEVKEPDGRCNYTGNYFDVVAGKKMKDQFGRKFVPDIDGNSFSGRYRGFLMSTSLPIKATIFKEWHDSRLIPWKHFVPMDNRFMDFWGIMEYFLGYKGKDVQVQSHDAAAGKIALAGQEWANKVLRTEDMQIYTLRLLLEYARVSDDRREKMGWVGDLSR